MSRSFLDCPHANVQQWTEICLDCGYNIYTSEEEYLSDLQNQATKKRKKSQDGKVLANTPTRKKIRALEKELNI